ncbi:MAG: response regulator [Candidatus Thiodiazotropha sp. (ex Rostrolucina anterorostrata)]|nr:response regulator [Candidatus Thiodiazotropha sp. (ex Rostrolucina anterorostrata)]
MFGTDELKILVVDDEKGNIEVLQSILKDHYGIIPALNGQKALELAQKHEPDLILLDIMMPGMDGYEVCKRLKNDPALAMIPVIFVTAMSEEEDEARGLQLGAVDYITKPVSPHIVRARVAIHIRLISAEQSLKIMDMVLGGARWWVLDPLRTVSRIIKGSVFEQEVKKSLRKVLKVLEQGRLHLKLQEIHFEKEVLDLRKLLT